MTTTLGELSNDQLVAHLQAHVRSGHIWQARLIAYLVAVESRRVHLELACSSMFKFCVERLGMSEGTASRKLVASRLAQAFPSILEYLERGDVHLCALVVLRRYLTEENHEELLREASRKTTRAVQEMLAARFPRPDVPPRIVPHIEAPTLIDPPIEAHSHVEPLSSSRYHVGLTVSAEVKEKLDRITELMRHRNPSGDLEIIIANAVDLLLAKLEKERLGKGTPRRASSPQNGRDRQSAAEVRREVFERDGEQCTYHDAAGHRCSERGWLQLDHVVAKAFGGAFDRENLRVRCRAHNLLYAEQVFGRTHIANKIQARQQQRESFATAGRNVTRRVLAASSAFDASRASHRVGPHRARRNESSRAASGT